MILRMTFKMPRHKHIKVHDKQHNTNQLFDNNTTKSSIIALICFLPKIDNTVYTSHTMYFCFLILNINHTMCIAKNP